jgi:hypothetical protein
MKNLNAPSFWIGAHGSVFVFSLALCPVLGWAAVPSLLISGVMVASQWLALQEAA